MEKFLEHYSENKNVDINEKIRNMEIRKKRFKVLKEKLEKHFNFEIVGYIIDDILDCETYNHICLMINLAVINKRLSKENGEILKVGIKDLFKVKDIYDEVDRGVYMDSNFNFDEWYKVYSTKEIVDLKKYFTKEDFKLLDKLGIKVKKKIYTEQEFECLNMDYLRYYKSDEMDKEDLKETIELPENVTREEYNNLLEKLNKISEEYKF